MSVLNVTNISRNGNDTLCVIMPCFNTRPELLRAAIQSVDQERSLINELGFDTSMILVDDCSTSANTKSALKEIEQAYDWVEVTLLMKNHGPAGARNKALLQCDSNWVAFLDSDDYWIQGGISSLCKILINNPSIEWISGDFFLVENNDDLPNSTFYPNHPDRYEYVKTAFKQNKEIRLEKPIREFLEGSLCSMGSCIISKNALEVIGFFNGRQRKGVDTELYWRLARSFDMIFVPIPVFVYRRHEGSVSSDGQRLSDWEPPVLRSMMRDPAWGAYKKHLRQRLLRSLVNLSNSAMVNGSKLSAMRIALEAITLKPHGRFLWKHLLTIIFSTHYKAKI